MKLPDLSGDPPRDPLLERTLRDALPGAPADTDWDRLHHAVDARAAAVMARRGRRWWEYAAAWSAAAIPAAAAAGLVLFALLAGARAQADEAARMTPAPLMEQTLALDIADADRSLVNDDGGDWLLQDALPAPEGR
ncbi:MAG: hypothetical protein JWM27_4459 [Gemmatimonadetes bacterium]|nr:hypothetical protein [Gemmatimonadota bacterium]